MILLKSKITSIYTYIKYFNNVLTQLTQNCHSERSEESQYDKIAHFA